MTDETKELLEDVKMVLEEAIDDEWADYSRSYSRFTYTEDFEAYGNTYVSTGKYLTEQSEEEFRNSFKERLSVDELIESLKRNPYFKETLKRYIESYAENKQIWV